MSEIIGSPKLEIEADPTKLEKGLDAAQASLGASMQKSERLAAAGMKRVQRQIDSLNAVKPQRAMVDLSTAVEKMGGVAALSADQVGRLKKQVDALAAAGAKVPKTFASLGGGAGLAGKAAAAAGGDLAGGLAPGGALGAGLSALGPAGIAAAAGIGAIAVAGKAASETIGALVERAGNLTDLSEKTGLSTDALQKLDFVGSQVGVSLDASAGAVLKLQRTLGEAAQGSAQAQQAFAAIGVSWQDLRGLKPEEQFARVADALRTIPDQERMVAAGADLMGKGFSEIIPLVRHAHEVLEAPVALDANTVKQIDDLGDAITRLGKAGDELKTQLGVSLLSMLSTEGDPAKAVDTVTDAVRGLAKIVTDSKFQAALRVLLGIGTMGLSEAAIGGIGALADLGKKTPEQQAFQGQVDRAHMLADAQKQMTTELAQQSNARSGIRKNEAEEQKRLAAEIAAEQKKDVEALSKSMSGFFDELAKRRTARETFDLLGDSIDDVNFKMGRLADQVERFAGRDGLGALSNAAVGKAIGDLRKLQAQGGTSKFGIEQLGALTGEQARRAATAGTANEIKDLGIQVLTVNDKLAGLGTTMISNRNEITKTKTATVDWEQQLANVAHTFSILGVTADSALGKVTAGLTSGLAMAQGLKKEMGTGGFGSLSKEQKANAAISGISVVGSIRAQAGGLKGALGGAAQGAALGSAFGVPGMVIGGLAGAVLGFFKKDPVVEAAKKAGKALGKTVSKELAQQFLEESKATGKSIAEVAKKWQAEQDRAAADAKRKQVEEGIGAARSGFEALLGDISKLQDTPELQAAIAGIEAKVAEAVAKSGLGFMATGALKTSEAFGAAQAASRSGGQVLAGMRQAGMVDAGLQAAMTGLATELQKQAIDAAKAAGLSDQEAQKAGSGAIVDILREQLNASLASGRELDANTKQMIAEARANGIEIIADPMLQSLKVEQQSLSELQSIRALMAGGNASSFSSSFAGEPFPAQRGLAPILTPNIGHGLGPTIQTHPGELALVVPRSRVGAMRMARISGADERAAGSGTGSGGAGPMTVHTEFPIRFDHSATFEQTQAFARAVAREARRLFDAGDPDFIRAARRRLGVA